MQTNTLKNLKEIAFGGLLLCGLVYLGAWLLAANLVAPELMSTITSYADLPTYLYGVLTLAASTIYGLQLTGDEHAYTRHALWFFAAALLAALTILDLFADPRLFL
jgi:hypothetical protein